MKWFGRRQSGNFDDRRNSPGGKVIVGGGLIGVVILLINLLLGGDPEQVMNSLEQEQNGPPAHHELTEAEKQQGEFVNALVVDNEDVWSAIFANQGMEYTPPKVVLFTESVATGCGNASSASGSFYCPSDRTVYMDMIFFKELQSRFGAKGGDFAVAYVVAHEVGHHVQTVLGTSQKVRYQQERLSEAEANRLSVALELQADFYAGVWTHHAQKMKDILEEGDIEEALSAANAVGDDAIQKRMQGSVVPDSFTHGTSQQRMYWFKKGFESGDVSQGTTFD